MYTVPELFKAAFSYRDFGKEVAFLQNLARTHATCSPSGWLDAACGSGEHLQVLAATGEVCSGVDISRETIDFAKNECRLVNFVCGNAAKATDFQPGSFHAAICMNDSISHFVDDEDVDGLFKNVSKMLQEGGIFVIETQFSRDGVFESKTKSTWECQFKGSRVKVTWQDFLDADNTLRASIHIASTDASGACREHSESFGQRRFTLEQLSTFAKAYGLVCTAVHGDFDQHIDLNHKDAWRAIYVFRKSSLGDPVRGN